jgi:hypothetical protein
MPTWLASCCLPSELGGAVELRVGSKAGARFEGVCRWRARYEADRGRSDLLGAGGPHDRGFCLEGRRLTLGDVSAEPAGDR